MSRASSRRASNRANRELRKERGISARAFMDTLSTAGRSSIPTEAPWLTCSTCKRQVSSLVESECFCCHEPAEGKKFGDMTAAQREALHTCGIKNGQHVDGWDGNWLDCDKAARR